MRRRDFRRTFVSGQFSPRPAGLAAVRQFTWGGSFDYIENGSGQLETRILQGRFQTAFENSDSLSADIQRDYEFLARPFDITGDVTIPVGGYEFQDFQVSYRMGPHRRLAGGLSLQHGEFFDGDITAVGYSRGRIEVSRQFAVEPSISFNSDHAAAGAVHGPGGHHAAHLYLHAPHVRQRAAAVQLDQQRAEHERAPAVGISTGE